MQNLLQLLNMPGDKPVALATVDTTVLSEIYNTSFAYDTISQKILATHPAIKRAEMNEEAARLNEKIARANLLPSLYINGNVSSNYNNDQFYSNGDKIPLSKQLNDNLGQNINIGLRIPIFSQFENMNRIRKERVNIENARLAIQEARNLITTNTVQLLSNFNTAKERYQLNKVAYEQNVLSHEMYREKFRTGLISSVELLAAEDILNAATSRFVQARLQLFFQYRLLQLLLTQKN